jgi:uncharacterized protein (DUF111 family)
MAGIDPGDLARRIAEALDDARPEADEVVVIAFHVDDQTPEDLAIGLERVRTVNGVLDVSTAMVGGKKGRLGFRVEVLARPQHAPLAIRACLAETATIGLRWHLAQRVTLRRDLAMATGADGRNGTVKTVVRPGGQYSSKLEADDAAASDLDHAGRQSLRRGLESGKRR